MREDKANYEEMPRERRHRWPVVAPAVGVLVVAAVALTATLATENLRARVPIASTPITPSTAAPTATPAGPDPDSGASLGPWTGADAAIAPPASPVQQTASALSVKAGAPNLLRMAAVSGAQQGSGLPASPARVYTFSAWVMADATSRPAEAVIGFFSATGSAVGSAWGQLAPDVAGRWTQATPVVGIAPAGTSYMRLGVYFYSPDAGEIHLMKAPSLSSHGSGSADLTGPLHTSGRTVFDGAGHPVVLRGTVSEWLDTNTSVPIGSPLDDTNVAEMKEWGANTVRVLLNENSWSPNQCGYAPGYVAAVDQVVQSITSRKMVALLGLHNNGRTSCGKSAQQRMADSPGSTTFWTSVAQRYKHNPLVAFDLYNEPHDITWDQWLNGGSLIDTDGVRWQAAGMRQMYDAVRNTGANNLAVISGNDWANTAPPPADQLAGSNVVYAVHAYTCPVNPPPICTAPAPYQAPNNLAGWSSLAQDRPVMLTEFGWPDSGSGTYNESLINWAQAHSVGWTAYGWAPAGPGGPTTPQFGLVSRATPGEPMPSGMPVVAALTAGQR